MSIELNKYIFDAVIMFYENCFEYLFIMNKHFIFIIFDVDSGWLFAKLVLSIGSTLQALTDMFLILLLLGKATPYNI